MAHIVVFDSGVGGLSVVQSLDHELPTYQLSYLFDNALFPYGELSEEHLLNRVLSLVVPFCHHHHPDLLVIACNTASTIALNALRAELDIPVVGVVPAIKPAALMSQSKVIGLLATPATIERAYTQRLIDRFAHGCQVLKIGSSKLVRMAEQSLAGEVINEYELIGSLKPWLSSSGAKVTPDTIILGCTHFPLLRQPLQQLFGEQVRLVDSGQAVAHRVISLLKALRVDDKPANLEIRRAFCTQKNAHSDQLWASFKRLRFNSLSSYHHQTVPCGHSQGALLVSGVEIPVR